EGPALRADRCRPAGDPDRGGPRRRPPAPGRDRGRGRRPHRGGTAAGPGGDRHRVGPGPPRLRPPQPAPAAVPGPGPPRDRPARFVLHRDGEDHPLWDLRALVPTVSGLGEKGLKSTRFKGLGEMDAEHLWESTMDPTRRTLLQVRLDDAAAAHDLFTTLMGDD